MRKEQNRTDEIERERTSAPSLSLFVPLGHNINTGVARALALDRAPVPVRRHVRDDVVVLVVLRAGRGYGIYIMS
jgi:hypothetical protein